jgi:glycosyltransferase involved in cell wall biosynthesis
MKYCSDILILFSRNGMKVFFPMIYIMNRIFKTAHVHHVVIGGNLNILLEKHPSWKKSLQSFEGNYVETASMKMKLNAQGIKNAIILSNFKELEILNEEQLLEDLGMPHKLCTFSRVMREKGIEEAINAVIRINDKAKRVIYTLDIYGQVDSSYADRFEYLMKNIPKYINYMGVVPFDKSVEVLKNYYLLLFPSYFDGEGFPGTLIDALSSGVPIIASDWHYNAEIIEEGKTGMIVPPKDIDSLVDVLQRCTDNEIQISQMKKNCIKEAKKFTPTNALKPLLERLCCDSYQIL